MRLGMKDEVQAHYCSVFLPDPVCFVEEIGKITSSLLSLEVTFARSSQDRRVDPANFIRHWLSSH